MPIYYCLMQDISSFKYRALKTVLVQTVKWQWRPKSFILYVSP